MSDFLRNLVCKEYAFTTWDREAQVWRVYVGQDVASTGELLIGEDGSPLSWDRFIEADDAAQAYNRQRYPPPSHDRWPWHADHEPMNGRN